MSDLPLTAFPAAQAAQLQAAFEALRAQITAAAGAATTATGTWLFEMSPANVSHLGKTAWPAAYFPNTPNTYDVRDAGDPSSDASYVMRVAGNARWEAGMVGATTDGVLNQSYRIKSITGTYLSEVFTDRFAITDALNPRYPFVEIYPDAGQVSKLRVYGSTGSPMFVIGTSNGLAGGPGTGAGLEVSYETASSIARITAIEHNAFYRDIVIEANRLRVSTGPVFLNVDTWMWTAQGGYLGSGAVSLAVSATVSNPGDAGIALMSGYVPGTDVLTAVGGTGTAPTFNVTDTQLSRVNSIAAAGTGGTPGAVVLTGGGGTGTKYTVNGVIGAGGNLVSVGAIVLHGNYTINPASLTNDPVTGGGLVGCQLNISMGALTLTLAGAGTLTVTPNTPTATTSSAAGTGATVFILYGNAIGTLNVKAGNLMVDGVGGVGGSFTTTDGKTVTVKGGVITSIV